MRINYKKLVVGVSLDQCHDDKQVHLGYAQNRKAKSSPAGFEPAHVSVIDF